MAQRTGVPSLIDVAKEMCRLILWAQPLIRRAYPENAAILVALDAAMVACEALRVELELVREYGS